MIDYGLSQKIINPRTNEHIVFSEGKSLIGTARFASISTHMGFEQSRRDDLESLGYLLVYLYSGGLPWQGVKAKTKFEKYNRIMELKLKMVPVDLCKYLPGIYLLNKIIKYFSLKQYFFYNLFFYFYTKK